jgi:hypothetical protein
MKPPRIWGHNTYKLQGLSRHRTNREKLQDQHISVKDQKGTEARVQSKQGTRDFRARTGMAVKLHILIRIQRASSHGGSVMLRAHALRPEESRYVERLVTLQHEIHGTSEFLCDQLQCFRFAVLVDKPLLKPLCRLVVSEK